MSSRLFLKPTLVVTNGNMASSITSTVTILNQISMISYDIKWTGAPTGAFSVEVSNTYEENVDGSVRSAGNWTPLVLTSPVNAVGSPDNGFIDVVLTAGYSIRLVYTATSGTGTLNAKIAGKVT